MLQCAYVSYVYYQSFVVDKVCNQSIPGGKNLRVVKKFHISNNITCTVLYRSVQQLRSSLRFLDALASLDVTLVILSVC